jgi:adenine/guanine phosphoribosyltransferase-like PRPP-binding protein
MSARATGADHGSSEVGARDSSRPAAADGRLRGLIREIPDFPRAGIGFKDITPLLADPTAFAQAVDSLAEYARPLRVDCVVAA